MQRFLLLHIATGRLIETHSEHILKAMENCGCRNVTGDKELELKFKNELDDLIKNHQSYTGTRGEAC